MSKLPYFSYKEYLIKKYGKALYSIPIDLGLGCPNRQSDGSGGCTFCPENGARAVQSLDAKNVREQIKTGIDFAKLRYKAEKFMLYIQAYTGTFTSVINQKKLYSDILKEYCFEAISIGTRPDCLGKKTLKYLSELNEQIDVHIDLGVQTLNDKTLKKINRGHDSICSINAIKQLKKHGIKVFAHIIVGLEGESRKDWENTVKKLVSLKVDGIKIHNLHIIKNTLLQKEYEREPFKIFNEYEYANEVINLLRFIPKTIPIIRINTDTLQDDLIAPLWSMQKGQFNEYLIESMLYRDISQGDMLENITSFESKKEKHFKLEDGSITIWDEKHKDYYHPKAGALKTAKELFVHKSSLLKRLKKADVNLLDIGFGMGYNSFEALKNNGKNRLFITAIDKNRRIIKKASSLVEDEKQKSFLESIYEKAFFKYKNSYLEFINDEARSVLPNLTKKYDIIFLDPFIHTQNPSLITQEFFSLLSKLLKTNGVIICSINIEFVKTALSKNSFKWEACNIYKTDIKGLKVTFGEKFNNGRTYRDPFLTYRDKQIISN